ncbi:MAG: hypothetical protein U0271_38290 [Polyangiaceae bacterium]
MVFDNTDVVSIAVNDMHACAVLSTGAVWCWSDGHAAELPFLEDVVDIALRNFTVCAVLSSGALRCLTFADDPNQLWAGVQPDFDDLVAIAGSEDHTCVLHRGGTVSCWGEQRLTGGGTPAQPSTSTFSSPEELPVVVPTITDAVGIAAGPEMTCVTRRDRSVACWGALTMMDPFEQSGPEPAVLEWADDVTSFALGARHSCAVQSTGKVLCWGLNDRLQLGSAAGYSNGRQSPVHVEGLEDAVAAAAGGEFTCARRSSGELVCWGSSEKGQLGDGATTIAEPTVVEPLVDVTRVAASGQIACAIGREVTRTSAAVWCWGGSLGAKPIEMGALPSTRASIAEEGLVVVDAPSLRYQSEFMVCVLEPQSGLLCYAADRSVSTYPLKASKVLAFSFEHETPALLGGGQVVLWQPNVAKDGVRSQEVVRGLSDAVDVQTNRGVLCAVRKNGRVACARYWHDQDEPDKADPVVELPSIKDAVSIGPDFCVVRQTGDLVCINGVDALGKRAFGQSGPWLRAKSILPGQPGVENTIFSSEVDCALYRNAAVGCWGWGLPGTLGVAEPTTFQSRHWLDGLAGVTSTSAGGLGFGCAIRKDGRLVCFGRNEANQCAKPGRAFRLEPAPILEPR